ncbi:RNA-binding protein [Streptococcus suis]|nr:RNA-binding protein [Streptococcus suis]
MKNEKHILEHFAREEKEFVEKIMDMCQQVVDTYSYRLTSFLNPRQDAIVHMLANYYQLQAFSTRDLVPTEYSRVILAPSYYVLDKKDFDVMALELVYSRKFHSLSHSQVLGTFLNKLGIRREYLGDILIREDELLIFLDKKFGELAIQTIAKIARVPVKLMERDWQSTPVQMNEEPFFKEVLVSSMRLDKLIAVAFHLSRTKVDKLITAGHVKLDYVQVEQAGRQVELGQLISLRKYGRIRVSELLGFSKQGKVKLKLEMIKT